VKWIEVQRIRGRRLASQCRPHRCVFHLPIKSKLWLTDAIAKEMPEFGRETEHVVESMAVAPEVNPCKCGPLDS
jgi:hypothetical protein